VDWWWCCRGASGSVTGDYLGGRVTLLLVKVTRRRYQVDGGDGQRGRAACYSVCLSKVRRKEDEDALRRRSHVLS
jgi:hypothetical protein